MFAQIPQQQSWFSYSITLDLFLIIIEEQDFYATKLKAIIYADMLMILTLIFLPLIAICHWLNTKYINTSNFLH